MPYQILTQALLALAGRCDGAVKQDGARFNGSDAVFGHSLADRIIKVGWLTEPQQRAGFNMIQKYARQLAEAGIVLPTQYKPVNMQPVAQNGHTSSAKPPLRTLVKLHDNGQIIVTNENFDARNPAHISIVEKIKALPERRYDGQGGWMVPLRLAVDLIRALPVDAEIAPEISAEIKTRAQLAKMSGATSSTFAVDMDGGRELSDAQLAGVEALLIATEGKDKSGYIDADTVGLGKTCTVLAYLQIRDDLRPAVVVCPSSVKYNWEIEAKRYTFNLKNTCVISGTKPQALPPADLYIINYDILDARCDDILAVEPKAVIYDEGARLKEVSTKRAKAAKRLSQPCKVIIPMTGTPIMNRPRELFPLLNMVAPSDWPDFFRYAKRFCAAKQKDIGRGKMVWDFNGASNLAELHEQTRPYMIKRERAKTIQAYRHNVAVPLAPAKRKEYIKLHNALLDEIDELEAQGENISGKRLALIEKLKQFVAQAKLPACIDWIEEQLEDGEPVVVFAVHREVTEGLYDAFAPNAVKVIGGIDAKKRQEAVETFQAQQPGKPLVFVGNYDAAGEGITLTKAAIQAQVEFAWKPAMHLQAEGRIDRTGQTRDCNTYRFYVPDTIEDTITALLDKKLKIIKAIVDGDPNAAGFMDADFSKEVVGAMRKQGKL